jgi:hypothetical protein
MSGGLAVRARDDGGSTVWRIAVFEDAGQELDGQEQGGSQPDRRPARRSTSRTSEETISTASTDNGNAWACQPNLAMVPGELAHVTVAESPGNPRQSGDRGGGREVDPSVCSACAARRNAAWYRCWPDHFTALLAPDLVRWTGSGSPSMRMGRFAWWDVRPTSFRRSVRSNSSLGSRKGNSGHADFAALLCSPPAPLIAACSRRPQAPPRTCGLPTVHASCWHG